jgi:large subunit ribosomal protein L40e
MTPLPLRSFPCSLLGQKGRLKHNHRSLPPAEWFSAEQPNRSQLEADGRLFLEQSRLREAHPYYSCYINNCSLKLRPPAARPEHQFRGSCPPQWIGGESESEQACRLPHGGQQPEPQQHIHQQANGSLTTRRKPLHAPISSRSSPASSERSKARGLASRQGRVDRSESRIEEKAFGGNGRGAEQEAERFQFFVKNLLGNSIVIETDRNSTVREIKQQIELKQGIPEAQQRLIFRGKFLENNHTAAQCALTKGVTVNLVLRLRGGPGAEVEPEHIHSAGDKGGLGNSIRIATFNVNRKFESKIEQVLVHLKMNDIDVGILQETGVGVVMVEACSQYGYVPYATELENAGVVILIRHDWDLAVISQPEIIEEGRAMAMNISTGEHQIVIVGIYHPSGLDNFGENTKEVKQSVKNIKKAIAYYNQTTQLVVVAGDFNDTSMSQDRIRPKGVATKAIGNGHTINPLLDAHFTDSHAHGGMTCFRHTLGKKLTRSRIDRIFFKSGCNAHAVVVSKQTKRVLFTKNGTTDKEERGQTDHALVVTEISTTALPSAIEHTKVRSNRLVFKNATDDEKTSFAEAIGKYFGAKRGEFSWKFPIKTWKRRTRQ